MPEPVERLVEAFWPGGLTIVLPAQPSLAWDLGETHGTVAVRMPATTHRPRAARGDRPARRLQRQPHRQARRDRPRRTRAGHARRQRRGLPRRRCRPGRPRRQVATVDHRRRDQPRGAEPAACASCAKAPSRARLREVLGDLLEPDPQERGTRVKQYVFTILFTAAVTLRAVVGGLAAQPEVQAVSRHPRAGRAQDADARGSAASRCSSASSPRSRCRRSSSVLRDLLGRPRAGLGDPRRDAAHRARRRRRRPVGPRLDDQARRRSSSPPGSSRGSGSCRSTRCRSAASRSARAGVSFTLTVFSIVVVMNAVNFIDGLDGLVAGVGLIANGVFFAYSLPARARHRREQLLQPRLVHRGRADRRVHRLPAAELDPGEAVHGRCRRADARPAHGHLRDLDHRPARPGRPRPEQFGRSQLLGAFIPILLPSSSCCCRSWTSASPSSAACAAGKSPFSPDRKHLHHRMLDMGHTDRTPC